MKKLLKSYELNTDYEYYEMICMSVINGQRTQAKAQFNAMPKQNKKEFLITALYSADLPDLDVKDERVFINEL